MTTGIVVDFARVAVAVVAGISRLCGPFITITSAVIVPTRRIMRETDRWKRGKFEDLSQGSAVKTSINGGRIAPAAASSVSIAVVVAVAPLLIETLLEPVASILRQILEAVPLLAQVFFISGRKILPALIVSLNPIFLSRRKIAPIVIGRPCAIGSQE